MRKGTLVAACIVVALLAGGYALFRRDPGGSLTKPQTPDGQDLDVEDFEAEEPETDGNTYNMTDEDEGTAPGPEKSAAKPLKKSSKAPPGVETIEEDEDSGETVPSPEMMEDNEESGVVVPSPGKSPEQAPPPAGVEK